MVRAALIACLACLMPVQRAPAAPPQLKEGPWRAWLDSPGGELPFGLDLRREGAAWAARVVNGPEKIDVPIVTLQDDRLTLRFDYYDSQIVAEVADAGSTLSGSYTRRRGPSETVTMPFSAQAGERPRFLQVKPPRGTPTFPPELIDGRWRVRFAGDDADSVGVFRVNKEDGTVDATFLTPTGDFRYLAGVFDGVTLRLSTFDGAHAFLFEARPDGPGAGRAQSPPGLSGDFWSGAGGHDTWTGVKDPKAALPDPLGQTAWTGKADALASLVYPDLDGTPRSLADPAFGGKARIIEVFGTWCPNCRDATHLLVELDGKYRARGLSIVGLAFEVTGDAERDRAQCRTYAQRHAVKYPILVAGRNDKTLASKAFPVIDRIHAYPTFIFIDGAGVVRGVYTGFSGPATGEAYDAMRRQFIGLIEGMLKDTTPGGQPAR